LIEEAKRDDRMTGVGSKRNICADTITTNKTVITSMLNVDA